MHYAPNSEPCPLPYAPFKSCTVPRPIGWLSTISPDGIANLAPYSQWQNLTFDPPMVMFAANQHADGRRKDSVTNAQSTGWFVWNMATYALRDAVNASARDFGPDVDEFEAAGLTKQPAIDAPCPMVAESPCHFECSYLTTHHLPGNTTVGTIDVVYGRVERIHVNDDFITDDGRIDILKIRPLARMGYYDYTSVTEIFEMQIPGSAAAAGGLEGRVKS